MEKFKNKVVWITGASSGFGEALAKCFASEGAKIVLSGRNREAVERVQGQIAGSRSVIFDMENTAVFREITEEAVSAYGHIDIIIHNAGIAQNATVQEVRLQTERKIMQVDYFSPIELTKCILPHFIERKSGTIVVVSGLLAYLNLPGRSTYAAAKSALVSYFGCLRPEIHSHNIHVNVLVPGGLSTELVNKALIADGSVVQKLKDIQGCALDKAAQQAVLAVYKQKYQSYIGNKKEFIMLKLWGLVPNFVVNRILAMSTK